MNDGETSHCNIPLKAWFLAYDELLNGDWMVTMPPVLMGKNQ